MNEYECGQKYAEWCYEDGCTEIVDYEKDYPSIPVSDYRNLINDEEIDNPDEIEYWHGYNDKMRELTK